ncbi:hemerythrin domain-containing protein [Rhodovulum euryhalinum]|uniref:Hemerythrin HHE cation binding domain-containing protein n=1 Tax=Rhodovulum euryhalinum TaxID=35805 RepID=A0A4V2SAG4_9RHOB|nr:hemerythrin domain-containing protein [Rhodovulum euryhalinum]TCO71570.1 hemerythrin HHE cation binding domain-containing protein [Rhodovulum euryhalinum]
MCPQIDHAPPRDDGTRPVDLRRYANPLDALAADHYRQRLMLAELERLAASAGRDTAQAAALLTHMETELPVHTLDEDQDLFPLLRRRAAPEDRMDHLLAQLDAEHDAVRPQAAEVRGILRAILAGETPRDLAALRGFASAYRRHMILENAVLLPLARARLTRADLADLRNRMAARRGLDLTPGTANAR